MTESEEAYVAALELRIKILETLLATADVNVIASMREGSTRE